MEEHTLSIFFRFAGIVAVMSLVMLFFVKPGTAEFVVTVLSLVLSAIVAIICAVLMNRDRGGK